MYIELIPEVQLSLYNGRLMYTGFVIDAAVFRDWERYMYFIQNIKYHF